MIFFKNTITYSLHKGSVILIQLKFCLIIEKTDKSRKKLKTAWQYAAFFRHASVTRPQKVVNSIIVSYDPIFCSFYTEGTFLTSLE